MQLTLRPAARPIDHAEPACTLPFRYLLFSGSTHYAGGGWADFKKAFRHRAFALQVAAEHAELRNDDWVHLIDIETGRAIFSRGNADGHATPNPFLDAEAA